MRRALAVLALMASSAQAAPTARTLEFAELDGWSRDDHAAALAVFNETCTDLRDPGWGPVCALAHHTDPADARAFFEALFRPVLVEDGADPLFTGYFEPELDGSPVRTARHRWPLLSLPPEADRPGPWRSRAQIEASEDLAGLAIAWVDDPVEKFFLQVQGSGRIRYADGRVVRVGYGGKNGHEYRSVGREMIRRGLLEEHQASAEAIRAWVRANPAEGTALLRHNPSYVFFREVSEVPAHLGPLGAMNRSITAMRSLAVDPAHVPLGAPVWIETEGRSQLRRLMVAQDTGSAIKGAQRADIFFGTGEEAGSRAGDVRDPGRMVILLPIDMAWARAPDEIR